MTLKNTLIVALALLVIAFFGKRLLYPSNEEQVESHISDLIDLVSLSEPLQGIQLLKRVSAVSSFFTDPMNLEYIVEDKLRHQVRRRDELKGPLAAGGRRLESSSVKLIGIEFSDLESDELKTKIRIRVVFRPTGERDEFFEIFEAQVGWKREDGEWKIHSARNISSVTEPE